MGEIDPAGIKVQWTTTTKKNIKKNKTPWEYNRAKHIKIKKGTTLGLEQNIKKKKTLGIEKA